MSRQRKLFAWFTVAVLAVSTSYAVKNGNLLTGNPPDMVYDHHVFVVPALTTTVTPICWTHTQDTVPVQANTNVFSMSGIITAFTLQLQNTSLNSLRTAIDLYGSGVASAGTVRFSGDSPTTTTNIWNQANPVWLAGSKTCAVFTFTGTDTPLAGYTTIDLLTRDVVGWSNH